MTLDNVTILEPQSVVVSLKEALDDIKAMLKSAIQTANRYLACGVLVTLMGSATFVSASKTSSIQGSMPTISIIQGVDGKQIVKDVRSEAKDRLYTRVDMMYTLEDGWDDVAAKAPNNMAISMVTKLIDMFEDDVLERCAIFPSNDSGLYLQGAYSRGRMTIYTNGQKMTYLVKGKGNRCGGTVSTIDRNIIASIESSVRELCIG